VPTPTVTPDPGAGPETDHTFTATVPTVLSLELTAPTANLGAIVPGMTRIYEATLGAKVTSTAGQATLSASDAGDGSGKLSNGASSLPRPLELKAGGGAFAPLTDALVLLTYPTHVAGDQVTISLRQPVAETDPLRAGTYSKRVVFTLSTTAP
jgi:hypothetical protein